MIVFFIYRVMHPPVPRKKWLQMLWVVCTAPFNPVIFRDGYIGDLLTSLVRVLIPMCFSFAYLIMSAGKHTNHTNHSYACCSYTYHHTPYPYILSVNPIDTLYQSPYAL